MSLRTSDILQIDAILITGVLILLTISADQFTNPNFILGREVSLLAWAIILPFSISALFALRFEYVSAINVNPDEQKQKNRIRNSIFYLTGGFVYLLIFLGIYTVNVLLSN